MYIISYVHKSVELLFQILGLVEVWTRRCMELSPRLLSIIMPAEYKIDPNPILLDSTKIN